MPLYSDLGLYGTPSTSYSGLYLSGPYSNHSSLLNSSYHSPIYVKALPRSFSRGYAPHLATISETQSISPLRRHFSPKIILHSSPKFKVPKPIKINTADIDVSVNKYRKYDRKTPEPKVNPEKSKSPSPSAVTENQDIEKTEPNQIRRDRALVRLHTVHKKDSPRRNVPNNGAEGPKSWRHNFYEDELKVEERRPKRTPGELLVDKFLIRTKEEEERLIQEGRKIVRKPTVKRPPSNRFHEICRVISSDTINEDLNPGQPLEIARRQSKQFDEDAFNKVRRSSAEIMESDQNILDDMLRKDHLLNQEDENNNIQTKRKKKVTKKKSNEKLVPDMEVKIHRRPTLKKIRRTSTDSSLLSDIVVDEDIERAYQEAIRDISQVEVEEIKVKPKPSFTATVDIDTKPNLKAVVDEVEIVESPTAKKPVKKFKYNVTVEIDEQSTPKMLVDENNLPQSTLNVSNSAIAIKRERSKSPLQEIKEEKMESISGKLQHAGAKEALSTVLPKKVNTTQKGENLEEIPKKVLAITQKSKLIPKDETPPQSPKIKNAFGKFGTDAAMKTKTVTQLADNKVSKSIDNAAVPANKLTVVEKCEGAETKQALVNNQKTHNEPLDRIGAKSNEVKKSKSDTNQEPSKTVNTTSVKTNELKKSSSVPKLGLLQSNEPTSPKDKAPKLGLSQEQVILKTDKGIQKANVDKSDTKIDVVIKKQDTEASKLLANEKLKLNELGPMSPKLNVSQLPKTQQKPEEHKPKTEEPRKQLGTKIAHKEEVKTNDVASPKCQEKLITVEPQSPKNIGNTSHVTEKPNAITKLVEIKSQPKQPQSPKKVTSKIEPKLAPKEDNKSGENFWDKICTRESVYLDSRRKKLQERRKASFITEEDEENERNSIHNRKTELLKSEEVKVQVVPNLDQKPNKLAGVAKVDKNEIIKIDDIKKPVEINRNEPVLQKKLESVNITKLTEDKSSKPTIKNSKEAALIPTLIAKENEVSKPSGLEAISKTEVPQISTLNKTPKTTTQASSAELIEPSKPLPTAIKTTLKPNDVVKQGAATVITTKSNEISPTSKQPSKVDNVDKPVDIPKPTAKLPEISTITSKLKESSSSLPKPKESTEVKIIDKSIEKLQTKNEPLISEIVDKITADEVNKKNKGLKLDIRKENYNAENTCQDKEKANGNQIVVQQLKESASKISPNKDKAKAVESKPKLKASKSEEKPIEANYNSEEKSSPKDKPIGNAKVVDESKQSSPEASTNKNKKLVKSKPKLKTEKSEEKPIEDNQESTNPEDNPPAPEGKLAKKIVSKRSLINKSGVQDPDLEVFIVPKTPTPPPVSNEPPKFIPLQSNRLSQWMHPYKKPDQLEECPIQIYARPKTIRHRYYPHKRDKSVKADPPKPPEPEPEEEEEEAVAEEEENDEEEQTSGESGSGSGEEDEDDDDDDDDDSEDSIDYEELNDVWGYRKVGASTSSDDSGFDSSSLGNRINKGCSERDSPTSNPAHNPAFALDPAELAEEFSQSSTFAGFQKSGRITPPATTIPRFRKYNLEDFHFLKVLGKGSFGKVLLAELKETEYYYAIKCLKKDVVMEDDDVECTLIERKVLALGTKHPYLCHLLCTFQTESHLFFVMEYLNGGDLMFHIQQSGRFLEPRARFYAAEIVSGLKFLHSKGIVYRDLKLDNILLDFDGHVRIADFGMCKLQIFLDRTADTFCGTPDYMAPEIIKGQHYNQNVDWWSFGVLLYEMLIGQSPFSGCDEDELFWSICNELPVLPRFLSKEANEILKLLLEKDATKRLGNKFCVHGDIQDQPFFHPIAWDLLSLRQLEPPFKPNLQHPLDTQYFDRTFTVEKAKLTPIEKDILQSMDQAQFQGFSYTNPNATDR